MSSNSTIEWTETTWNPVVGCTKVSPGCAHCYAERMSKRLAAMAQQANADGKNAGRKNFYLKVINKNSGSWSGDVQLIDAAISDPFDWRSPRVVFVNSMSDLFHKNVPLSFIKKVFRTMNDCPQHTFQVLTKRPERTAKVARHLKWTPNIWMGTSVDNNDYLDRVRTLQQTPAKVRFLSVEPLLGPIPRLPLKGIHWVIVGGESGPGARPMEESWVTQIRDRCVQYEVPFFFKQWGGVNKKRTGRILEGQTWDQMPPLNTGGTPSETQPNQPRNGHPRTTKSDGQYALVG